MDSDGRGVAVGVGLLLEHDTLVGPAAANAAVVGRNADAQKSWEEEIKLKLELVGVQ